MRTPPYRNRTNKPSDDPYCDHHNFFSKFARRARCKKYGFVMQHDTDSEIVETAKTVVAAVKTGKREMLLAVIVAAIGALMALWAVM